MKTADMRPIEILLVEDSPSDTELTVEALRDFKVRNHVSIVEDGVLAMQFLRRQGPYANAPRPDLILLDLNLPRKGGREVLEEIKNDPNLKAIPVVVLTVSDAEKEWGINRYQIAPETVFVSHETYTPARGGSASAEIFALRHVFKDATDQIVIANTKGATGHPMAVGIEDVEDLIEDLRCAAESK